MIPTCANAGYCGELRELKNFFLTSYFSAERSDLRITLFISIIYKAVLLQKFIEFCRKFIDIFRKLDYFHFRPHL